MPSETYNLGCYLLDRIAEVGCNHLFGVPGDYNLRFLDDVEAHKDIAWIGCANELNAAYAADGYARCRGFAAVLTTYGVGELSALNGIAGAYAECNAVLHIVGGPSIVDETEHVMKHHTLGDGNFQHFSLMSEQISVATGRLNKLNAVIEIDRVLTEILYEHKPGYILLPQDMATFEVSPPVAPLVRREPILNKESLKAFTVAVEEKMKRSKKPAALVGYLCDRFGCTQAAQRLVDETHMPFAHMLLGKGTLNEHSPTYIGCYFGSTCSDSVKNIIEGADVCVMIGVKFHDFGTGYFSQKIDTANMIDILPFCVRVGGTRYPQIPMAEAIKVVHAAASLHCTAWPLTYPKPPPFNKPKDDKFSGLHLWGEIQAGLAPGDIVVVDQGTSSSAGAGLLLPKDATFLVQCLWGSIGFSIPAAFGAQLARPKNRVILAVGDGSAQMTAQEFGSFLRHDLRPIVFLVDNAGYVIERVIHGWNAPYNDIAMWNWTAFIKSMTRDRHPETMVVDKPGKILPMMKATQTKRDVMHFVQAMLDAHEMPIVSLAWAPK